MLHEGLCTRFQFSFSCMEQTFLTYLFIWKKTIHQSFFDLLLYTKNCFLIFDIGQDISLLYFIYHNMQLTSM